MRISGFGWWETAHRARLGAEDQPNDHVRVIADAEPKVKRADELSTAQNVAARLKALEQMDHAVLRVEWRRFYRAHAPKRQSA
jgi:hypothetical protein